MSTQFHEPKTVAGAYWRRLRVRHLGIGWSRVELAHALGISERTAQRWECGRKGPPTVYRYALLGYAFAHGKAATPAITRKVLDGLPGRGES